MEYREEMLPMNHDAEDGVDGNVVLSDVQLFSQERNAENHSDGRSSPRA